MRKYIKIHNNKKTKEKRKTFVFYRYKSMMKFKFFKTQRLIIRRLTKEDAKSISSYRSIPEVAEFQSWSSFSEVDSEKLIEESNNSDPQIKGKWFQFGIEVIKTGELIGDIGFLNSDEQGKSWIGFTLNSEFWHQGYATEAVTAILSHYADIGIHIVWASTASENHSSKKLLERLGFELSDSKPDDLIFKKQLFSTIKTTN